MAKFSVGSGWQTWGLPVGLTVPLVVAALASVVLPTGRYGQAAEGLADAPPGERLVAPVKPVPVAKAPQIAAPVVNAGASPAGHAPALPLTSSARTTSNSSASPLSALNPVTPVVPEVAAKTLFGAVKGPAPLAARAIGSYSRGCLAGAKQLPVDGPEWQAMRLSRNRNWGTPELVSFLERFAQDARRFEGWPGLLVGDMSQPRGGPMASSHASHQVGLDVDIWFNPMPNHRLTAREREDTSASTMVDASKRAVNKALWTPAHARLLHMAAVFGEVERIFVHPAIKRDLCETTINDPDRIWLYKMRPSWGHDDHFHVRLKCPEGMEGCTTQAPPAVEDGCGKELTDWLALVSKPSDPTASPSPPTAPLTMDKLPAECRQVLDAPSRGMAHPVALGR